MTGANLPVMLNFTLVLNMTGGQNIGPSKRLVCLPFWLTDIVCQNKGSLQTHIPTLWI